MKFVYSYLLPFIGRHWLRIAIVGVFLFLINKKQIDLSIQLGKPVEIPSERLHTPPPPTVEKTKSPSVLSDVGTANNEPVQQMNLLRNSNPQPSLSRAVQQVDETKITAFLRRFVPVAQTEQEKYGIPPSIILASGLLYSAAGTSPATEGGNNYFLLSCTSDWVGPTLKHGQKCIRFYQNAWTSFRDHSLFITTGKYAHLTRIGPTNYRDWAKELESLGYNETQDLAQQLISVIEQWQLFQYD